MQLVAGDTFDRYTIEAQIGEGGMGRVYRAYDERLRRRVALKILRIDRLEDTSSAVPRVLREARAAAALDHPGSVAIFDVGEASGVPFIAMEHIVGRSLRSYIGDATAPVAERLRWLREIARALAAAHAAGLVHLDVKPENVMVRSDGVVKVLDFGIARQLASEEAPLAPWPADPEAATFDESRIVGTPAYMAPEQVQRRPVDARADQFAWGVVAYELLRGALPWEGARGDMTMQLAVVTERQPRLSADLGVPPHIATVVDRALEKDADRRFPSMTDLLGALEPASGSRASKKPSAPPGASFASDGTLFVGREAELARLRAWIADGKRLVTILGPPGMGKTRLARVAAARELGPMFGGQVWLVDLSEAESVADVVHASSGALGVSMSIEVGSDASIDPLAATLSGLGRAAIVFDDADRIVARHAASIARLLSLVPDLSVVVTSRERLLLPGEHVLELGPLSLPAEGEAGASIERAESVALFVDRARAVRPGYQVDADELACVGELVRLLDGLPLGIELAAARMTMLDAAGLLERLRRRAGTRSRPDAAVDAAIDASWSLLDPAERSALAQCSVFRGGFDLDAAEAVVDLDAHDVLDTLERLRDRSLLAAREPGHHGGDTGATGRLRFFLYLSIREFAAGKLDPAARRDASRRHAQWYATRMRVFAAAVREAGSAAALAALALERDNLRAIPERLDPTAEDIDLLFQALLSLDPLEHAEGTLDGHLRAIDRALGGAAGSAELRARTLLARGRALLALGRAPEAIATLGDAIASAPAIEAEALLLEAHAHAALGSRSRAHERATHAAASATKTGQALFAARADALLAALARDDGRLADAAKLYTRARIALRAVGARADEGRAALDLGLIHASLGATDDASRLVAEATALLTDAADPRLHAAARAAFGGLALDSGRGAEARAACEEALDRQRQVADRSGQAATLALLAGVSIDEGDSARAEEEALAALALTADPRLRARLFGTLALGAWERGQGDAAAEHARQAIACARAAGDRLAEALFAATLGAIEASQGRSVEAAQAFDEARRAHQGPEGAPDVEAASLAEAFDDLSRVRGQPARSKPKAGADPHRARARARLARVLAPGPSGAEPLARRSFLVRALARRLHRALSPKDRALAWAEALDAAQRALVVDVASLAVRLPGRETWIDLGGKRHLFRLLTTLAAARLRGAARPVSAGTLAGVLWPGDDVEGTTHLVDVEVAALRATGLGDLVHGAPEGYALDPAVPVLEVPRTL